MSAARDNSVDANAIASRVRVLLAGRGPSQELAEKFGVSESALAQSVDEFMPRPTVDVLLAVVGEFGVDPTWLLTGSYDAGTHRVALEGEPADLRRVVSRLLQEHSTLRRESRPYYFRRDDQTMR
jgi:transcriptional regulator with XRE-family HTH domain